MSQGPYNLDSNRRLEHATTGQNNKILQQESYVLGQKESNTPKDNYQKRVSDFFNVGFQAVVDDDEDDDKFMKANQIRPDEEVAAYRQQIPAPAKRTGTPKNMPSLNLASLIQTQKSSSPKDMTSFQSSNNTTPLLDAGNDKL